MHEQTGILILIFVVGSLLIGAATRFFMRRSSIPYSVSLLIIGLFLGTGHRFLETDIHFPLLSATIEQVADIDPHLILFILLPTLIFESAYSLEVHLFRRIFNQIAILAIPGLIVSTLLTAAFVYYLFPWQWSWAIALLFGALISATDPVAVVALLNEVSSRKRLETLIEGESLLN
ncbi:MAG: cation:proton antiporter, partial [Pseudomonadales bacterium]|nr:cation:proton antiporter [Pseudomonadales bacterium]